MVNVTYDACECDFAYDTTIFLTSSRPAGDLIAYTPDGTQIIYNLGDIAWVTAAMALVWIMIPGVGLFYSGLLRRKNALSMIWTSLASIAVVSFQVCSLRYCQ
jgi:Ammonium Transporter Family